jgi:hypothetical protein
MLLKFLAVVYLTPIFSVPGVSIAVLGAWLGRVYMKAQIAIKREMSNAKAPVLGHFGASVAGLSAYAPLDGSWIGLTFFQSLSSVYSCVWRTAGVPRRIVQADR